MGAGLGLLVMTLALGFALGAAPVHGQGAGESGQTLADLARSILYPRFDAATGLAGEAFRSPSLGRDAADLRLADFRIEPVPRSGDAVAVALLKPAGFPPFYTLIEVALLRGGTGRGLVLEDNLKVRVDSGSGSGDVQIRLQAVERSADGVVTFEVVVTADGQALAHRFDHRGIRMALVSSQWAR